MNYQELVARALKQRSVTSMAKVWGIPQPTLNRYVSGKNMPDYDTAFKMAQEAGVDPGEAFAVLAAEARDREARNFKLQRGFVQTQLLLLIATGGLYGLIYIM